MPLFFFRIRNGRYSGASEQGIELADRNAAWQELTSACAGMISGICRKLAQDSEWEMEMLDELKRPVFRIRLVADPIENALPLQGAEKQPAEEQPAHLEGC